jgi:lysophospholipase L1-like esterase
MRSLARKLGGLAVALAVFLVTGEVLARALDVVDRLNGYSRVLFTRGPSVDLPYLLRPGLATTFLGTAVRVNRLGLRGPEVDPTPRPGVRRVLVLGDSVVFGQGLADDDTVARVLERRLDAAGGGPYEVLNAGVPGFDTVAEARWLEAHGLGLRPEVVVVGASLNDYDVAPTFSATGFLTRKDLGRRAPGLVERSEFLTLLRWLAGYVRGTLWHQTVDRAAAAERARAAAGGPAPDALAGLARVVEAEHLRFYRAPVPAYWDRLRTGLGDLARLTAARGVRLLVAIFPEEYQVAAAEPDLTPQRRLLEACREAGVACLDLRPAFVAAGGDLFTDVQHPNAEGHAVAAAAIAAALRDADLPPAQGG